MVYRTLLPPGTQISTGLEARTPTVSLSANLSLRAREPDLMDLDSSLEVWVSFQPNGSGLLMRAEGRER